MGQRVVVKKIVRQALMGETAIFEITMDSLEEKGIRTFPLSPSHDVKSLEGNEFKIIKDREYSF